MNVGIQGFSGQPNSLEQMGRLASLSSFLGPSLSALGWIIGAHLSSLQSALTSFPAGQRDVFHESRPSVRTGAGIMPPAKFSDFFLPAVCLSMGVAWSPGRFALDFISL